MFFIVWHKYHSRTNAGLAVVELRTWVHTAFCSALAIDILGWLIFIDRVWVFACYVAANGSYCYCNRGFS